jgi:hypothetical protein
MNCVNIGCSFKFPGKFGVAESIVNALRITDHGSAVEILRFYTSGAFTIDFSTPTLTGNLSEHSIPSNFLSSRAFCPSLARSYVTTYLFFFLILNFISCDISSSLNLLF